MKLSPKILFLTDMFNLYCVKLLDTTIPLVRDNRLDALLLTSIEYATGNTIIYYNSRRISRKEPEIILLAIFHELRHVQQGLAAYDTFEEKLISEKDAEMFANKMVNELFPQYTNNIKEHYKKLFSNKKWIAKNPIHYQAYKETYENFYE